MTTAQNPFRMAAFLVLISACLLGLAPFLGGFSGRTVVPFSLGLLFVALGYGLLRGWRWVAYVALWVLMISSGIALAFAWPATGLNPLSFAIAAVNWLAVGMLVLRLWRPRSSLATSSG